MLSSAQQNMLCLPASPAFLHIQDVSARHGIPHVHLELTDSNLENVNTQGQLGIGNLEDSVSLRPLTGALRCEMRLRGQPFMAPCLLRCAFPTFAPAIIAATCRLLPVPTAAPMSLTRTRNSQPISLLRIGHAGATALLQRLLASTIPWRSALMAAFSPGAGACFTLRVAATAPAKDFGNSHRDQIAVNACMLAVVKSARPLSPCRILMLSAPNLFASICSGAHGQLGHPQLHALHMMQVNAAFVVDTPRKLDSLDPFRLQPWKR